MKWLSVFAVCVCSTAAAQTRSPTTAKSLFGIELTLHPQVFFSNTAQEHVGFPTREAEVLLHLLEKRVPLMKSILEDHEKLQELKDKQIANLKEQVVSTATVAAQHKEVAAAWKETAQTQAVADFWEDLIKSPYLWAGVGVLAGAGIYALIDKFDGRED
jgi:hypothetical protein